MYIQCIYIYVILFQSKPLTTISSSKAYPAWTGGSDSSMLFPHGCRTPPLDPTFILPAPLVPKKRAICQDMSKKKNEKLRSSHFGISRYGSLYLDGGWMWGEFWFCFVAARIPPARGLLIQAWPSSWFQTPLENLSGEIDVTRIIIQSMISIWNHMKLPNVINVVSKLPIWNGLYHAFLFISCKTVDGGYIISL